MKSSPASPLVSPATISSKWLAKLRAQVIEPLGNVLLFAAQFYRWLLQPPWRWKEWLQQMEVIGLRSIPIIALTGVFTGMVFGLQSGYAFRVFNAETLVGSVVGLSLTREISPVFTALMLIARNGSAMAAELGAMRVSEQIDALETMAVNPMHYLVIPRIVASTVMAPLLCVLFSFIGIFGAYLVATQLLDIHPFYFMEKLEAYVDPSDVFGGLIKAAIFGFLFSLISCYQGYNTEGGSRGVGLATTRAVVVSSVMVLVVDYFLTAWILEIFPDK